MKTAHSTKALLLLVAGISCAAIALSALGGGKHAVSDTVPAHVIVTETKLASGETLPVVTVTAKKLSATQKIVMAVRGKGAERS